MNIRRKIIAAFSVLGIVATLLTVATGGHEIFGWISTWFRSDGIAENKSISSLISSGYSIDEFGFFNALTQPDLVAVDHYMDAEFSWFEKAICTISERAVYSPDFKYTNFLVSLERIRGKSPKFANIQCPRGLEDESFQGNMILIYLLKIARKAFADGLVRGDPLRAKSLIIFFSRSGAPGDELESQVNEYLQRVSTFSNRLGSNEAEVLREICMAASRNRWVEIRTFEPIFDFIQPKPKAVPAILNEVRQRLGDLATFPGAYDVMVEKFCQNTVLTAEFVEFLEWLRFVYEEL